MERVAWLQPKLYFKFWGGILHFFRWKQIFLPPVRLR